MLSYKHGFHCANHADILKHLTLCLLLSYLNSKDKPYTLIDTHSGAGIYELNLAMSQKNQEYKSGIVKIEHNDRLRSLVPSFYEVIEKINTDESKRLYPGSPCFEQSLMRKGDRLVNLEMHPHEFEKLKGNMLPYKSLTLILGDGLLELNRLLPPLIKRGLVFIDPSYEDKNEYTDVIKAIRLITRKWNTAMVALWYPILGRIRDHSKNLGFELSKLNIPLLQVELRVEKQQEEFGMCGSGLYILNYPYTLESQLKPVLEELYTVLANKDGEGKLKVINQRQ